MSKPRRVVVVVLAVLLAGFGLTGRAVAHTGGQAISHIADLRLEPAGTNAWSMRLSLEDFDSGAPISGAEITAEVRAGGKQLPPVTLGESATKGQYGARLAAAPGDWSIVLAGEAKPGWPAIIPLSKHYHVKVTKGQELVIDDGGSGGIGLLGVLGIAVGAIVVLGVGLVLLLTWRRRRTTATAAATTTTATA